MEKNDFFEMLGYLTNPIRNSLIEIEAKSNALTNYSRTYQNVTGYPFPYNNGAVTSLSNNSNKWGLQLRVYFLANNPSVIPHGLNTLKTGNNRQGYANWNFRLNNNKIIKEMFSYGFLIGMNTTNVAHIRGLIPPGYLVDFNRGYSLQ